MERAIEIWPYIVTYVDQVKAKKLPNPRSSSYDNIAEAQMDPIILAKLHFFMSLSRRFQPFLTKYQTDAPVIPLPSRDLEDLIRSLLRHFIKQDVQVDVSPVKLVKLDVTDQRLWVSPKQVDIDMGATAAFKVMRLHNNFRSSSSVRPEERNSWPSVHWTENHKLTASCIRP